jgi:hypothetical protein
MTKVFLLRYPDAWISGPVENKTIRTHYAGAPFDDPENLNKARTFKTARAARQTNEFKHWGYTDVVEAQINIQLI